MKGHLYLFSKKTQCHYELITLFSNEKVENEILKRFDEKGYFDSSDEHFLKEHKIPYKSMTDEFYQYLLKEEDKNNG